MNLRVHRIANGSDLHSRSEMRVIRRQSALRSRLVPPGRMMISQRRRGGAMSAAVTILGIDPGLRRMGWGVVRAEGSRLSAVAHGVVAPPTDAALAVRLDHIFQSVTDLVTRYTPDEAAIEEAFMAANASSALKLGHARAAALLAPARPAFRCRNMPPGWSRRASWAPAAPTRTRSRRWSVSCCRARERRPMPPMPSPLPSVMPIIGRRPVSGVRHDRHAQGSGRGDRG